VRGGSGDDILRAGADDDVVIRLADSGISVDCGPGNDIVVTLGALQTRMYPTIGFKIVANCEHLAAATDPGLEA
jgi:hypothetical protein